MPQGDPRVRVTGAWQFRSGSSDKHVGEAGELRVPSCGIRADDRHVAFELIRLGGACNEEDPATALDFMEINEDGQVVSFTAFLRPRPQ